MYVASIRLHDELEIDGLICTPDELYKRIQELGGTKDEAEKIKKWFKKASKGDDIEFSKGTVGINEFYL